MKQYLGGKEASEVLGVHQRTLYLWDKKGKIETFRSPGGKRFYNVGKYIETNKIEVKEKEDPVVERLKIIYARVSSHSQKDDLTRQIKKLKKLYPGYKVIEDIGSGLNLKKRGIKKIINCAIAGKVEEVVVMHKDRLARFGFDLIEYLIKKYSKGVITIVNKKLDKEPEEEMVEDVLQVMNVFVAKMNGRRRYNKKMKEFQR